MNAASTTGRQATCRKRIHSHLRGRLHDLRALWTADSEGPAASDDLGRLDDYALCFDYVAPGTFSDQKEGYFRYQLSWGGPSDEFRFFVSVDHSCHRIEYWFLDWFDGAHRTLSGEAEELLTEIWQWLVDSGAVDAALRRR